jgi:amino acid adenylation domain-containing protein
MSQAGGVTARTLDATLRASAAATPDATALQAGGRALSYAALAQSAAAFAAGLRRVGVARGDRVAIALPSGPEAVIALYGTLWSGAAAVPINAGTKQEKLRFLLEHSGAAALVATPALAELARVPGGTLRTIVDGPAGPADAATVADLLEGGPDGGAGPLDVDLAAIIYTSGSTGRPKGVTLTHRNLVFVTGSIVEYLELTSEDRVLSVLPLSFGYGLTQLLTCVEARARLVLEPGFGYPGRIVELLTGEQVTGMPGVPTIFRVLASLPGIAQRPLEHLRFLTNAGAALSPATAAALRTAFPNARLYPMYGQTECIRVCYLPPDEVERRPSSVGVAIPGTEVWIEDEQGNAVAPGEVGELVVRGAHVMQGYWGDPAGTARRLREGRWPWERVLHTGDLFRTDADGYLHFVSRTDDIIKSRGEKVAPREVEEVLHTAPGVCDVAVVGVPDDLLGEAVQAHVSALPGYELDPRALRRLCAERLEDHMVPRSVIVHAELPKSENGKIDRLSLAGRRDPAPVERR